MTNTIIVKTLFLFLTFLISCLTIAQEVHDIEHGNNTIHLTTYGSGEPILIINGGPGMHSEGFKPLAKIIAQTNMAIIYDQRGTGRSKIPLVDTSSITIDSMVADIEVIRNYLNLNSWIVLGHSFGGMLASYYTSRYPERVKGLILSSSGGIDMDLFSRINITSRLTKLQQDSLSYWTSQVKDGDTTYFAKFQKGKFLAPAYLYDQSNVPVVAHRLTQVNLKVNQLVFQDLRKIQFDCSEDLKKFKNPVLIIQGREDIVDELTAQKAHSVFQKSTLVLLEECVHYGWLDQPERYFESINNYLAELER